MRIVLVLSFLPLVACSTLIAADGADDDDVLLDLRRSCGNGVCDRRERCGNCPQDCGACAAVCGDGQCADGETCDSCAADCGTCATCGDGQCTAGETCGSCAADCGACDVCGDGQCGGAERCNTCAEDCGCVSPQTCGGGGTAGVCGSAPSPAVKAFPTAEGFGARAVGGRGGRIVRVTNLNAAGPGSLRDALEVQTGPRIVVFDVSGTIDLGTTEGNYLWLRGEGGSYVTIAGQTSPGGIQIKGNGLGLRDGAHDVIVRHLRVRPGTHLPQLHDTNGFIAWGIGGKPVSDIIVDHCSFEWSTDQNGPDATNWVRNFTSQWNIIAEGTTQGSPNGPHSMGMLVAYRQNEISMSVHHNLLAHNMDRNPNVSGSDLVDFRNNVIYNWSGNGPVVWGMGWGYGSGDGITQESALGNLVNNVYLRGPNSGTMYLAFLSNGGPTRIDGSTADRGGTKIYAQGNWSPLCPTGCADDWKNGFIDGDWWRSGIDRNYFPTADPARFRLSSPLAAPPIATDPTPAVLDKVLAGVGATRPLRDAVDARIVGDVRQGTGNINNVGAGGPWPSLTGPAPAKDSDGDGMPDEWETGRGLNPFDGSDGRQTAANGYTHVENHLNALAGDLVP